MKNKRNSKTELRKGFTLVEVTLATSILALEILKREHPEVLLVDPAQESHDPLEFLAVIQHEVPLIFILVLTMKNERLLARCYIKAGIMGYVTKTEPVDRLLIAVKQEAAGGIAYSTEIIQNMIVDQGIRHGLPLRAGPGQMLSFRQLEVFEMIDQVMDSHSIAERLSLSPRTVDVHKVNIRNSLGLGSASEVLRSAILRGKDKGAHDAGAVLARIHPELEVYGQKVRSVGTFEDKRSQVYKN